MAAFDLAVIGAGAAGLSVTNVAARLGLKVALIERGKMGGDCLNTGCVPSKALLAAAHAAIAGRHAARFGVRFDPPDIDWAAVRAHVRGAIAAIEPNDSAERYEGLGATVLQGQACFVGPDALDVAGNRITARRIIVAAGSRPAIPPIPGLDKVPFLTNETLWDLAEKPGHLLILGGGPIGLEMAQAHAGLGCTVTVVEAASIADREDPELVAPLRTALLAQGIVIHEGQTVVAVEPGPTLVLASNERIRGSHLLVAVGRQPNLEGLDLDRGNVCATEAGIATDPGLCSLTNKRVFAAGDIADPTGLGPRQFTHVCTYHAGIIVRRALFRLPARVNYAALPRVTYTAPELAQTGLTEAEARAAGHDARILRGALTENDRAIAEGDTAGMIKLVTARGRIIGAGILAPHAGEMISQFTQAIVQRTKLSAIAGLVVPYPTRAEIGKRAAIDAFTAQLFSPRTQWLVRLLARLP